MLISSTFFAPIFSYESLFYTIIFSTGLTLQNPTIEYITIFKNMWEDSADRVWNDEDKAYLWLPRVFYCLEQRMGVSGGSKKFTVYCMSQLGSWVEGFFAVNIFLLWFLAFMWLVHMMKTSLYLLFFPLHNYKTYNPYTYRFKEFSLSQKLFVILLMQNTAPMLWKDIVKNILNTTDPKKIDEKWRQAQRKKNAQKMKRNQFKRYGQEKSAEPMDQDYIVVGDENGVDQDYGVSIDDNNYRANYEAY
jgi:hypothetical protein